MEKPTASKVTAVMARRREIQTFQQIKNPLAKAERVCELADREDLRTNHVGRLKSLGAFKQIELDGLALVQRAIPVLLDGGEMHEHVLSRGALDEPIPLRPVEPLHSTLLSHKETPFASLAENYSSVSYLFVPGKRDTPSKDGKNLVASPRAGETAPTKTAPEVPALNRERRNTAEPRNEGAISDCLTQNVNLNYTLANRVSADEAQDNSRKLVLGKS